MFRWYGMHPNAANVNGVLSGSAPMTRTAALAIKSANPTAALNDLMEVKSVCKGSSREPRAVVAPFQAR
jgi:hypothetical protein